jgi:hypothetical protein
MTICTSGISQPKASSPASLSIDSGFMASLLPSPLNTWLVPFLSQLPPLQVASTATFCSIDPSALPVLDATVLEDLLFPELAAFITASGIVLQVVQYYLWFSLCECSAGTQPTPSAGQSEPSGIPAINPTTIVSPNQSTPCFSFDTGVVGPNSGGASSFAYPVGFTSGHNGATVPQGASYVTLSASIQTAGGTHTNQGVSMQFYGALPTSGAADSLSLTLTAVSPTQSVSLALGTTDRFFVVSWAGGTGNTDQIDISFVFYCNGQLPGGTTSPCCAPDPTQTGLLNQILSLVTLIQRQDAPFAYVPGADHAGLTGDGVLTIADLIGVKVDITSTLPPGISEESGYTVVLYDVGWIQWGTADGFGPRQFIDCDPFMSLPALGGLYTQLAYSLHPGITVTITELDKEP